MNAPRSYASGFVDALALVAVTLFLLAAALLAGCEVRTIEDGPVCPELYCECAGREDCFGYGGVADPIRGTCGPSDVCTIACASDDDCGDGTCGPDEVAGVVVCTPEAP